jgi:polyhydroxybutyrate depolymerase
VLVNAGRGDIGVHVPAVYDPGEPAPLIVLLHGYTSSGMAIESWFRFAAQAETYGFLLMAPDGTRDILGNRFWNATNACCNIFGSNVDDSTYLRTLIEEVKGALNVDERRVYLAGHSNGGFMSYRMACDHADTIAAIASLAGATFDNPAACAPSEPVDVLQIHGTNDGVIAYGGGTLPQGSYPGAVETAETWATYNACAVIPDLTSAPIDLVSNLPGAETTIAKYEMDCLAGGSAELWTIEGGVHSPSLTANFAPLVIEWLLDHPKPGCYADCDGNGSLDVFDFLCFQDAFVNADPYADCDGNGVLDVFDFLCYQDAFVVGCG